MSILTKNKSSRATHLWFTSDMFHVRLHDGREISIPLEWFPKLRDANDDERNEWQLVGNGIGIHWKLLDEDISVKGLLR